MNQAQVVALMESSKTKDEWNANCTAVQVAFGGSYPGFWYADIIQSGVADKTAEKFGKSADITVTGYSRRPLPDLYGRPTSMPYVGNSERVIGIYDQGLGEKAVVCNTLADMQTLYDSYAQGMALSLKWAIESVQESVIRTS